jgi:hypothetical protein
MNKYECDGFRSVYKESMREAAQHFAQVAANRLGKNGSVGALYQDSWGYGSATYQAFVGKYNKKERHTVGNNMWLTISIIR